MSVIKFARGVDGVELVSTSAFSELFDFDIVTSSSTRLAFRDEGDVVTFFGSGLSYSFSGGVLTGVTAGTVSRITITFNGATMLDWSKLSVGAPDLANAVFQSNWTLLNRLMLGGNDQISATDGTDRVNAFAGADLVRGYAGSDTISGGAGNDTLYGGLGQDRLNGDTGNDRLLGEAGADSINGGGGADVLIGGTGIDTLAGGAGADIFVFVARGSTNRDVIKDFDARADALHFDNDAFTGFAYTGALRKAQFVTGTAAQDAGDRLIYQQSTGRLWYDADGTGAASKMLVADLRDGAALTAVDIFII